MAVLAEAFGMFWKAAFFYVLLVTLLRLMGKREIGSLTAIDLVVFIMISEAAIISIEDKKIPLLVGVTPVVTLAAMQFLTAWLSLKSRGLRGVVEGKPTIVVHRGRIDERALASLRFNLDDLLAQLREKNVPDVADVEYAILETDGRLSVIPKAAARPATPADLGVAGDRLPREGLPVSLIADGVVDREGLRLAGRDEAWLNEELRRLGIDDPGQVILASLDPQGRLFVQKRGATPQVTSAGKA